MENFDNELKKAAENFVNKEYSADIPSDISETAKEKINSILKEETMNTRRKFSMKRGIKVLLIAAAVMLMAVVVAASPQIIEYINMMFLKEDSAARLTEVPEGYIGIYDAEDLDNVRNDLHKNYILMNDIVLTEEDYAEGGIFEGGFEPIGSEKDAYTGIFNGNGYVIDGLVISTSPEDAYTEYVGLFSNCERFYSVPYVDEDGVERTKGEKQSGIIKNLGVINATIEVTTRENSGNELKVGAIAGHIDYLVGCYAENIAVNVTNSMNSSRVYVGGLAGDALYIDSCYAIADITVKEAYTGDADLRNSNYEPCVGGVAGYSYACVTSYFDGNIDSDYGDNGVTAMVQYTVPMVLTKTVMDELCARLEAVDEFYKYKFLAFYVYSDTYFNEDLTPAVYMTTDELDDRYYILDPSLMDREMIELNRIIESVFPDNTFIEYCIENDIKAGTYYCYDLREPGECTFEGFDLDNIWLRNDHLNPTLRLFSGGSKNIRPTADERPTFGFGKGISTP